MLQHLSEVEKLHIKEWDYSLWFFCIKKAADVKSSALWSTGLGMAWKRFQALYVLKTKWKKENRNQIKSIFILHPSSISASWI